MRRPERKENHMTRREMMTNKIFNKIEEILDLSYELCENEDPDVSNAASKINNEVYRVKKHNESLKKNLGSSLYKLSKKKKVSVEDFTDALKNCGINLENKR